MLRSRSFDLIKPNLEIERTIRRLLKKKREQEADMVNNEECKALGEYAMQSTLVATSCIIKPTIQANCWNLDFDYNKLMSIYTYTSSHL